MAIARAKNRKGEQGDPGQPWADAVQPQFAIGDVTSGTEAAVTLTGTKKKPVLNFVIPKGKQGEPGKPGKQGEPGKNGRSSASAIIASENSGGSAEDGSALNPFTTLNVKRIPENIFHAVKENHENVVSRIQIIEGVFIVNGVNTIL